MDNLMKGFTGQSDSGDPAKPCRACTDFKSWVKMSNKGISEKEAESLKRGAEDTAQCPLDKDELGQSTWSFLHTMAAYYPEKPQPSQQKEMSVFMKLFSKYYPCDHCAKDFRESIAANPPETESREKLAQWLCRRHNEVNRKLGKEEFDCKLVDERWKDGWQDGTCG